MPRVYNTLPRATCLALWERAAQHEFGICVEMDNIREFQRVMYEARKGIAKYADIVMCLPEGGEYVFLVKKTVEVIKI